MACLKCGRETERMFCDHCRAEMEKYPVKPGTIILLPKTRKPVSGRKATRRPAVSLESRIVHQQKVIRGLVMMVVGLIVLLLALGSTAYGFYKNSQTRPVGQNYSTVTRPTEETAVSSVNLPR